MATFRKEQIRQILDDDNRINRQIMDRQRTQVKMFGETTAPATNTEIGNFKEADDATEAIKATLEKKISAIEKVLLVVVNIGSSIPFNNTMEDINNNSQFIREYNYLFSQYADPSNGTSAMSSIKTKFQELKPYIDSIVYGLDGIITKLSTSNIFKKFIVQTIKSYSIYLFVQKSLNTETYSKIDNSNIDYTFNNYIEKVSAITQPALFPKLTKLKKALDATITKASTTGAVAKRAADLAEEYNTRVPGYYDATGKFIETVKPNLLGVKTTYGIYTPAEQAAMDAENARVGQTAADTAEQKTAIRKAQIARGENPEFIAAEIPISSYIASRDEEERQKLILKDNIESIKKAKEIYTNRTDNTNIHAKRARDSLLNKFEQLYKIEYNVKTGDMPDPADVTAFTDSIKAKYPNMYAEPINIIDTGDKRTRFNTSIAAAEKEAVRMAKENEQLIITDLQRRVRPSMTAPSGSGRPGKLKKAAFSYDDERNEMYD